MRSSCIQTDLAWAFTSISSRTTEQLQVAFIPSQSHASQQNPCRTNRVASTVSPRSMPHRFLHRAGRNIRVNMESRRTKYSRLTSNASQRRLSTPPPHRLYSSRRNIYHQIIRLVSSRTKNSGNFAGTRRVCCAPTSLHASDTPVASVFGFAAQSADRTARYFPKLSATCHLAPGGLIESAGS